MITTNTEVEFSARILAADNDGNIYLYIGDDDWSITPYQWGDSFNQVWFQNLDKVDEAIQKCGHKPRHRVQKNSIEYLSRTITTITKVITR
jgi:hypothetical protein